MLAGSTAAFMCCTVVAGSIRLLNVRQPVHDGRAMTAADAI